MIRIGIVGVGATVSIAHYHALGYLGDNRCKITALFDINKEGAERFIASHNLDAVVASNYEDFLDRVDAVSICTPNAFHFEYASKALERGKHVLVEKPLGVDITESRILEKMAKESAAKSAVGLVYRFSDTILKTKELVTEHFSTIYTVSGWFGGKRLSDPTLPFEWRMDRKKSGTGALGDFSSHLFDIASFITGKKVDSVTAMTSTFIKERVDRDNNIRCVENDDSASIIGKAGDTLIEFTVSRVGMDDVFILLTGDGGMIEASLRDGGKLTYWPKDKNGGYSGEKIEIPVKPQKTLEDWFSGEIPAFLDLIEGKDSNIASISDGLYAEEVIQKAFSSSIKGRSESL